jgi:CobQ-like glutamine amidotransferase family enzyme
MKNKNSSKILKIVNLYPTLMGTYGDFGNTIVLSRRLNILGYKTQTELINVNDSIPADGDIYILGGGEDSGQEIAKELLDKNDFKKLILEMKKICFVVCAGLQILGSSYEVDGRTQKKGLDILNFTTKRLKKRAVGEVISESDQFGTLTGYENHGGGTFLHNNIMPLGIVKKGVGNNDTDNTEGFIFDNIIGTYMHGPVLARNPNLADFLIEKITKKIIDKKIDIKYAELLRKQLL